MCSWFLVVQGDPWLDAQDTAVTVYRKLISMDVLEEKKKQPEITHMEIGLP